MNYHAVPTNSRSIVAFRYHVKNLWRRTRRRLSQKDRGTGSSFPFLLLRILINLGSRELTTDLLALRLHVIAVMGWQGKDKTSRRMFRRTPLVAILPPAL